MRDLGGIMTETVTVDPKLAKSLLNDALTADAAKGPAAEPPPRVPWLLEDGSPRWGVKADGTPRRAHAGPGAPKKDADKARTTDTPARDTVVKSTAVAVPKDYSGDLEGSLTMLWLAMGTIPPTQTYAVVIHEATPALVPALNAAAQENEVVRKYVSYLGGTGSYSWALPLAMALAPVAAGLFAVARAPKDQKEALRAKTKSDMGDYIQALQEQAGVIQEPKENLDETA
jgi:hypothetical protein